MDLRKIKVKPDDFGLMTYDPAFMNTACCKSNITFIDGDKGILRYRGYDIDDLAENCTFLQVAYLLLYGELPNPEREQGMGARDHLPHHAARDHQALHRWLPLRRPSHGNPGEHAGGALHRVSGGEARSRPRDPATPDRPPDRQDADPGGLFLSPPQGPSVHLSRQRSQLYRELHEHAVADDRAEVRGQPGHRPRARHPVHPARRPRAELQLDHHAGDRQRGGRSVPLDGGSGGRSGRPAARRRQRRGAAHARRDRLGRQHSRTTSSA